MPDTRIHTFLELCRSTNAVSFNSHTYVLPHTFLSTVTASGIPFEQFGEEIRLKLKPFFCGCDVQFSESISDRLEPFGVSQSAVLVSVKGSCWFDFTNGTFTKIGILDDNNERIFRNAVAYFRFFDFLRSDGICDYFNDANGELVFYNSAKGIIKVSFEARPIIDFLDELEPGLKRLQELASSTEITSVFVNAVYQISQNAGQVTLKNIVADRLNLIDITKRDYELISKKFDFAKFRNSLYAEKEKYFKDIREVVNKIFSQAIGIPISIGASVFTTYKVQGDNLVVGLVLVAFVAYIAFYLRLQWIYKQDIVEVESQFKSDFAIIAQNSGLPANTIDIEKKKVERKFSSVQTIQKCLIALVICLGILVITFMGTQFSAKKAEEPDPTIKELIEAIKKFNLLSDSSKKISAENKVDLSSSPETFSIKVNYDKNIYNVKIERMSPIGHPTEYWATILTPKNVLTRYPTIKYIKNNDTLIYTDSLSKILPGFAKKQMEALLGELKINRWEL